MRKTVRIAIQITNAIIFKRTGSGITVITVLSLNDNIGIFDRLGQILRY